MSERAGIVVTGASSGLGRACALDLAGRGFQVFAGVRDPSIGRALADEAGGAIEPLLLDVTDAKQIAAAAETVDGRLAGRPLAGLLNNAGITVNGPLEFVPPGELRRQLEVNVVGQLAVTQAFLPRLRRDRGRVVLMGSVSGILAIPGLGPYCMSKHALESMADVMRVELAPWGIRVALIQPGQIQTPIWEKGIDDWARFADAAPAELEELYGGQIEGMRRMVDEAREKAASPDVVARAVAHAFTARRPRSRYLVGGRAGLQRLLARLPDSWRDRIVGRLMS